jgi:chromosome segregation ATPase
MQPGPDQSPTHHTPNRRLLTVHEAATALNLTVEAVRSRIKRGTLAKEKSQDGTVYVVLNSANRPDQARLGDDQSRQGDDQAVDQSTAQSLLIERLENEIGYLRQEVEDWKEEARQKVEYLQRELEVRNEELRRKDTIIMSLTQRIPELEPAQDTLSESRESVVTATEESQGKGQVPRDAETPSWWRRIFQ